ncbi:MAG: GtrA family protein [Azospira oryzae]|jgi:putative flippase GtrA|nr:MAG: GtrA family protein [Azospira oryzae]
MIRTLLSHNFIRYIIVGVISMAIEMGMLILLVERLGLPVLESNLIAFVITNIVNYILSRLWVFEKSGRKKRVELVWFSLFLSISLLLSQVLMWIGVDYLHLDYKITKLISIVIVVAWNFLTRKHFVFARQAGA